MKKSMKTLFVILFILIWTGISNAQFIYIPYYGKNKVNYVKFQWEHYQTDHFDIYYYTQDVKTLKKVAEYAESAYAQMSEQIKHQLSAPVPLIYFTSTTDFVQTNMFQLPESVLGVSEPVLYRVAVHGDMTNDELQDLIEHELAHIFEYDLLWGSPGGVLYAVSQPPSWMMEGFSEYSTESWSFLSELIVRDAVLNDRIPEMTASGQLFSRYPLTRDPGYDFGHSLYDFIVEKYGKNTVRELWQSMKNSSLFASRNSIQKVFGISTQEFHHEYKKHVREKNKKYLLRENPENYSLPIGPAYPINPYFFSFSHSLSPSGDLVAILTINALENDLDILLLSVKDGKVIRNITKGYTLKYEQIKFEIDPSSGKDIIWSADGDRIAFFGRAGQKHSLFVVNALSGKTERIIKIPVDSPAAPRFLKGENEIIFTAYENTQHDIYKINLESEKIINLTQDDLFEKAPAVSPDGNLLVYTIRVDTDDKIFLSPINDLNQKTQITFGKGNTITPEFSSDGEEVYFAGDQRDAFNIYSINLDSGELRRYTDVQTGNFFPIPVPNTTNKFVFSAFNKGAFQVFTSEFEPTVEKTVTFVAQEDPDQIQRFEPILTFDIDEEKITPYKGIGKLYMTSRPPIDTVVSTDGSIYGGSAIAFSDLMGDHNFNLMAYQVRNFRSYFFSYVNMKNRLQWMTSAYQYTIFYYPDYAYYDPYLYQFLTYRDSIATRKISGVNFMGLYPLNRFYRLQGTVGFTNYTEDFYDPYMNQLLNQRGSNYSYFLNGNQLALSLSLIGETTRFNYYGPKTGNTFRLAATQTIPVTDKFIQNTTLELDYRHYLYIGSEALFAFRFDAFMSMGRNPYIAYYGGNNEVRTAYYYSIIGNERWFANLEFRLPLVNAANTLIGQIGPVRGTFFFDVTRSKLKGFPSLMYRPADTSDPFSPLIEYEALGSYGFGFEFFFLGFPIHLDYVKRLEWPKFSRPFDINTIGGWETKFWIGFDF